MRLRPGAKFYQNPDHPPVFVRRKATGDIGVVTRVCPAGNHIPPQAHVVFGNEDAGFYELWCPLKTLERAG